MLLDINSQNPRPTWSNVKDKGARSLASECSVGLPPQIMSCQWFNNIWISKISLLETLLSSPQSQPAVGTASCLTCPILSSSHSLALIKDPLNPAPQTHSCDLVHWSALNLQSISSKHFQESGGWNLWPYPGYSHAHPFTTS